MRSSGHSVITTTAVFLMTVTCCIAQEAPATAPASNPSARGVIDGVMRDALKVLRDQSLTRADKLVKIRQIADLHTDFETLARLSMGKSWKEISEAQQKEFVKEFANHVSATHGKVFDEYVDEDVIVTGDRQEMRGDYTVQTRIIENRVDAGRRKDVANVDYRLRQKDNHWQIIDVTIDGVSMAANFRAQFQDIMANGGIERLLKLLRDKQLPAKK